MHRPDRHWVGLILVFTAVVLIAGAAFAQENSGNIFGTATDKTGAALPGVTVTLSGVGAPQTFVTDAQGQFRFLRLSPGKYMVKGELEGFSRVQRPVDVAIGSNTEVPLRLDPSVSETITVSAASPVIDRRDVGTGASIEQIELKAVPTARDPWVVLQSVPGVLVDRVNVGGNKSGQQSYFVGKGVERNQTVWNVDGVNSTDMSIGGGAAGFYLDFDSFQEFKVTTGSADPSVSTPGVQLNMVTKRGTNELKGSGRYMWTGHNLQATPRVPAEGALYGLTTVNSINEISEGGAEIGGPIIQDRVWLWGAYSKNPINAVVAGNSAQYQKTDLTNFNGKINTQLSPNNAGFLGYLYSNKTMIHRGIGPSRPVETSYNQSGPGWQWTLEDTQTFTPNLYLTGRLGKIINGYIQDPVGGLNTQLYYDSKGIPHGSYWPYQQAMPQKQANLEGSQFLNTGPFAHELKFGFGYRHTPVRSFSAAPGDQTVLRYDYGEVEITRAARPLYESKYSDVFAGDTISVGNLTFTPGFRYDMQQARNKPNSVEANPVFPELLPAATFPGDPRPLKWNALSPRVGLTYSLSTEKRTLLRASYASYSDQLNAGAVGSSNPFYNIQILWYYWDDLNSDGKVQKNELGDFDIAQYVDPNNPASPTSTGRVDYGMRAPKTNEYIAGIEREVSNAFALGINYTHRLRTNLVWTTYEKTRGAGDFYTPDDFVASTPVTGTLPDGSQYTVPVYKLKSGIPKPLYTVTTNRPDYNQTYDGLELTATKRMLNNWMLRGNVTLTNWKQHVGQGAIWDPGPLLNGPTGSSGASCTSCLGSSTVASAGGVDGYINSRWSASVNGVYQFPHAIQAGLAFTARDGYIIPYYRRVKDSAFGNKRVLVGNFDDHRLPNLHNLDLRVAKVLGLPGKSALELSADVFNVTNQQTVLWRDNRLYTSDGTSLASGTNDIQELQSPRIWRLGARFSF